MKTKSLIKRLLLTIAIIGLAVSSYGQGIVNFGTAGPGADPSTDPNSVARVSDILTGVPCWGSLYYAQLYAADGANAPQSSLTAKGVPVNFKGTSDTSKTAGYVKTSGTSYGANGPVAVPSYVQVTSQFSGQVTLQIRVWSSEYTTYESAVLNSGFYGGDGLWHPEYFGWSELFNFTPAYGVDPATDFTLNQVAGGVPNNPNYYGISNFTIGTVPEPSTIALGVMGLSTLLFRRRK